MFLSNPGFPFWRARSRWLSAISDLTGPSGYLFGGFGQSADTIGDYIGAPGIGPGEPFNMQLALKFIF